MLVSQQPVRTRLPPPSALSRRWTSSRRTYQGLEYQIAYNPTEFIAQSIRGLIETIYEAVALVVVVVLLFLQRSRPTMIPIVAIPVSLVGTFAVMAALGFSINNLTLFGLVLAVGIVVDDTIVVVEMSSGAARRHNPSKAALRTMAEVGGPVVSIALVLSTVFMPTAFLPGISGGFSAVRGHHRRGHRDLGLQFADAVPRAGLADPAAASRKNGRPRAGI